MNERIVLKKTNLGWFWGGGLLDGDGEEAGAGCGGAVHAQVVGTARRWAELDRLRLATAGDRRGLQAGSGRQLTITKKVKYRVKRRGRLEGDRVRLALRQRGRHEQVRTRRRGPGAPRGREGDRVRLR